MASTQPAIRASAKPIANRFAAAGRAGPAPEGLASGGIGAAGSAARAPFPRKSRPIPPP